jgi:uncharacterized protein YndB with AHSA1/START domain
LQLQKIITVDQPVAAVFAYLADFTTTTEWDPGTVRTVRESGEGGVGTRYRNTSRFLGRETELTYVVQDLLAPHRIRLRGENASVVATDTITVEPSGDGSTVTYVAHFAFKGVARVVAPLLRPALTRLGRQAEAGMRRALTGLGQPRR